MLASFASSCDSSHLAHTPSPISPSHTRAHVCVPTPITCRPTTTTTIIRFIRGVLDEAGGHHIKIISKIESWHGVINYDDILAVTGTPHGAMYAHSKCIIIWGLFVVGRGEDAVW